MGYDLRRLRSVASVPMAELVETVRKDHPKMDKPLMSKCMNPEAYGVTLIPPVVRTLAQKYDAEGWQKRRRTENRTMPCSIRCRMTEQEYARLMKKLKADGFKTAQEWAHKMLLDYINAKGADADGLGST